MSGTAETEVLVAPVPTEFDAATRNVWVTPLTRFGTVAERAVDTPSSNVVHVVLSVEYCTT